jgi:hypothetical protein
VTSWSRSSDLPAESRTEIEVPTLPQTRRTATALGQAVLANLVNESRKIGDRTQPSRSNRDAPVPGGRRRVNAIT